MVKDGKNWAMLKARVLVLIYMTHPEQMKYMRATSASTVECCLSLPN